MYACVYSRSYLRFNKEEYQLKKLILFLVVLLVAASISPAAAFSPRRPTSPGDILAVAWQDGERLYVAIANDGPSDERFTISPDTGNRAVHNLFRRQTLMVPRYSVLIESIDIERSRHPRWSNDLEFVLFESRFIRGQQIPVQRQTALDVGQFVAPSSSTLEVHVDIGELVPLADFYHLHVDDEYTLQEGWRGGRIDIVSVEGGFVRAGRSNEITYEKPSMVLSMRTPTMRGADLLTFGITHVPEGRRVQETRFDGPIVLVYGSNLQLLDYTSRIPRTRR